MHDQLDPAPEPEPESNDDLEALKAMNCVLQHGHSVGITDSELTQAGDSAELVITHKGKRFLLSRNDLVECIS